MTSAAQLLLTALGAVLAAVITGFVAWKVAKRQNSGSIDTSEAASLWQESAAMRTNLADQLVAVRNQLTASADSNSRLIDSNSQLLREIGLSNAATAASREETRLSREESAALRVLLEKVHNEVKTANSLSLGALADNTESRRIADIPEADRTEGEKAHMDTVGIQEHGSSTAKGEPEEPNG
jgi:hypothetical protein